MQDSYESLVETQSGNYILTILRYSSKTIDSRWGRRTLGYLQAQTCPVWQNYNRNTAATLGELAPVLTLHTAQHTVSK